MSQKEAVDQIEADFNVEIDKKEPSLEELDTSAENNFVDIVSPEDAVNLYEEKQSELHKNGMYAILTVSGGLLGIAGGIGNILAMPLTGMSPLETGVISSGLLATGGAAAYSEDLYFRSKLEAIHNEMKDLEETSERWAELPGVVDLSYLTDQSLETQFDESYQEWLENNIQAWSRDSMAADLADQELVELGIDVVERDLSASSYGVQRVYLDEIEEDCYQFVLQTYDGVNDEVVNSYWGFTDEKGRKIVGNNDALKEFEMKSGELEKSRKYNS